MPARAPADLDSARRLALGEPGEEIRQPQPFGAGGFGEADPVGRFLVAVRGAQQQKGVGRRRAAGTDPARLGVEIERAVDGLADLLDRPEGRQVAQIQRQGHRLGRPCEGHLRRMERPRAIRDRDEELVFSGGQVVVPGGNLEAELSLIPQAKLRGRRLVPVQPVDSAIGFLLDVEAAGRPAVEDEAGGGDRKRGVHDPAEERDVAVPVPEPLPRAVGQPDGHALAAVADTGRARAGAVPCPRPFPHGRRRPAPGRFPRSNRAGDVRTTVASR